MSTPAAPDHSLPEDLSPARQWLALVVLLLPVLVISIDNTVLGFAVPALSADLRPSSTELLWIVDSYAFVLAGLLVTMGNLGDRVGRRRLLLIGAGAFGVASVLAAYSKSPAMLIAARALLGVAGATLMPSTLSIIRTTFTDVARRRVAIGLWTAGFAVGAAFGPIVGGWLLEHFWWGSVFLLAAPIMLLLVVVGPFLLPESRNDQAGPLDLLSSLLSFGAVLPVVYAIKKAAEHGPSPDLAVIALVGLGLGVVFIRRQRRLDEPLLDLSLFANRPFVTAISGNLLGNFAFLGAVFLVAQYLQMVLGLGPMAAGMHLLPGMIASFFASLSAAAVLRRARPGPALAVGLATMAVGFVALLSLDGGADGHRVMLAMTFIGLGFGAASSVGANLVMAIVPARRAGAASAISETAFELGAATGIAVLGSVTSGIYRRRIDLTSVAVEGTAEDRATDTLAEAVELSEQVDPTTAEQLLSAAHDAFASGIRGAAIVAAVLLGVGAIAANRSLRNVGRDEQLTSTS